MDEIKQQDSQRREQRLLLYSALVMGMIGAVGLLIGIWSGSQAVLTDGAFSVIAMVIKLFMLLTSYLVAKETSKRFQFGYWQMEPIVLFIEGMFILLVVLFAAAAGIRGLLTGGREVDFGLAIYYGIFFELLSVSFYFYVKKVNQTLGSNLVKYDNVSWYVDMVLAGGLLASFFVAWLMQFTPYAAYSRYVDPLIMLALSLHMVIPACRILIPACRQLLCVAPADVHERVQKAMEESTARFGFKDYVTSVQQYGHTKIIEIDILVDKDYPVQSVSKFDEIRNAIDRAIGYPSGQKWVTITFTTTRRWMAKDYLAEGEG